ncbi:MAG: protein TolR [Pseudomonadota bacterium]|nr:protein TolR [Pseudomonadota bacterium]
MRQGARKRRFMGEMNVVPYIDVMLVLLIIFMITTPLLSRGVEVDLPQADAQPLTLEDIETQEPIILTVDAEGRFYLSLLDNPQSPVDVEIILTSVSRALRERPDTPVLVQGDNQVPYGSVVTAMVVLQQAGAPSVGLMTEPPEQIDLTTP